MELKEIKPGDKLRWFNRAKGGSAIYGTWHSVEVVSIGKTRVTVSVNRASGTEIKYVEPASLEKEKVPIAF